MPNPHPFGRSEKISIRTHRWRIATPLALRLLCIVIALQALGMRQVNAADAALKEPARSVVLIDSQLVTSIPKSELVSSQIKSYFFEKTKIDFPLR